MSETLVDIKLPELFSAENAFEVSEYEKFLEHARFVVIPARNRQGSKLCSKHAGA
jgi:hypothetical protein